MDIIELNISIKEDTLKKLESIDFNNFANGLVIFYIQNAEYFPIIYRLKTLSVDDITNCITEISEKHTINYIYGYTTISNNIFYFNLI